MMCCNCRWKALDFAALDRSSVSFFNVEKHETAVSRWARARTRAAKVGKGLSKNEKAQKLALQHWLEAVSIQTPSQLFLCWIFIKTFKDLLIINRSSSTCRLTHAIVMATTCTFTTISGSKVKAANLSSTGWTSEMVKK